MKIPVTVKTRLGWDHNNRVIVELAEQLQDCGIAAITVHGRTRSQMYTGEADWEMIARVKENPRLTIPVIGNGDIDSPERLRDAFSRYGVDGVMVGRAAIGNPWIFNELKHGLYPDDNRYTPPFAGAEIRHSEAPDSGEHRAHRRIPRHSSHQAAPGGMLAVQGDTEFPPDAHCDAAGLDFR